MADEELKARLEYLRGQLKEASTLAPEERDKLSELVQDVVELVTQGGDKSPERARGSRLRQALERQAAEFDAEHPRTSGVLRQIGATLERMGI